MGSWFSRFIGANPPQLPAVHWLELFTMKLSLENVVQLIKLYKAYEAKSISLIQAIVSGIEILSTAGVSFADVITIIKEVEPIIAAFGVK
jgi:hypothetical protein